MARDVEIVVSIEVCAAAARHYHSCICHGHACGPIGIDPQLTEKNILHSIVWVGVERRGRLRTVA
jgi:hypothetical protein